MQLFRLCRNVPDFNHEMQKLRTRIQLAFLLSQSPQMAGLPNRTKQERLRVRILCEGGEDFVPPMMTRVIELQPHGFQKLGRVPTAGPMRGRSLGSSGSSSRCDSVLGFLILFVAAFAGHLCSAQTVDWPAYNG